MRTSKLLVRPLQKTSGRCDITLKIDVMPAKCTRLFAVNTQIFFSHENMKHNQTHFSYELSPGLAIDFLCLNFL